MIEIAKAVSYEFDILIMDEPTSALTDREVDHLFRIIADLKAQGKGIVYITHKMNELFTIADDVSIFRDGRYIATHPAKDLTRDQVIQMMVGREITQMFPKEEAEIGDVVLVGEGPLPRGCVPGRLVRCAQRARSSASRVWSAPAAPTWPRPSSA